MYFRYLFGEWDIGFEIKEIKKKLNYKYNFFRRLTEKTSKTVKKIKTMISSVVPTFCKKN